jgi:hypothetical protein
VHLGQVTSSTYRVNANRRDSGERNPGSGSHRPSLASILHRRSERHVGVRFARDFFYAAGWKKFERLWDLVIRARQLRCMTPLLEAVLAKLTGEKDTAGAPGEPPLPETTR